MYVFQWTFKVLKIANPIIPDARHTTFRAIKRHTRCVLQNMKSRTTNLGFTLSILLLAACTTGSVDSNGQGEKESEMAVLPANAEKYAVATVAGGCFWCTEAVFERIKGVEYVVSGYAGGSESNPTYEGVSAGRTSHAEAIQIYYDSKTVSFETLMHVFFTAAHDPTQLNRQGPDTGTQYRSMAFYRSDSEKIAIDTEIAKLQKEDVYQAPIVTQVVAFDKFYTAENYHQDYYPSHQSNPYIIGVTRPKVEKFEKKFSELLKDEYAN